MTYTGPEHPSLAAIEAARDTVEILHQWAGTAHRLVWERIEALTAADPDFAHPLETAQQHAARVYAGGQEPFPRGVGIHENLNDNRGYDHVWIGYGRIHYGGHYPEWNADGTDYTTRWAEIDVPVWLVTDPDGPIRYRQETAEMVAKVEAEGARLGAELHAIVERLLRERNGEGE